MATTQTLVTPLISNEGLSEETEVLDPVMPLGACLRFVFITTPILLWDGIRLLGVVIALSPGFVRFAWYYFVTSRRIVKRYAPDSRRQFLDIYTAKDASDAPLTSSNPLRDDEEETCVLAPVVIFLTGGAWIIGYKMWAALLARALVVAGVVVVVPDYRNYPGATVPAMVQDSDAAIEWAKEHVHEFGGDKDKIVLVGQSAGGHLAFMRTLLRATRGMDHRSDTTEHEAVDVKGCILLSTPFNIRAMGRTFSRHGFDNRLVDRVFGHDLESYDPTQVVQRLLTEHPAGLAEYLPPIRIYNATSDRTVPHDLALSFHEHFSNLVSGTELFAYDGWSHTDAILEKIMDADHRFHRDVFRAVEEWTETSLHWPDERSVELRRLCPSLMVKAGRFCNPF